MITPRGYAAGPALKRIFQDGGSSGALHDTKHRDAKGAEALLPRMNRERRRQAAGATEEAGSTRAMWIGDAAPDAGNGNADSSA